MAVILLRYFVESGLPLSSIPQLRRALCLAFSAVTSHFSEDRKTTTPYTRLYILEIISSFVSPVFLLNLIVSYLFAGLASRLLSSGDWAGPLSSASLTNDVAY